MYMCACGWVFEGDQACTCTRRRQKSILSVLHYHSPSYCLRQGFILNVEFTILTNLAGLQAPMDCLSVCLSPLDWSHKYALGCLAFYIHAGNLNPHACPTSIYPSEPSPQWEFPHWGTLQKQNEAT